MREGLDDSYGILLLQDKILEIASYIDIFCDAHSIDYCLMGGSALGAKRHGGFIPWDDDLDIFMTPDNYEKFREYFIAEGDKEKFYLQEYGKRENGMVTVPKFRMNGTTYLEALTKDWNIHQGIYVDIFILHICPNQKFRQIWQFFWAKCVVVKGLSLRGYNRHRGLKKVIVGISKFLPKKLIIDYALKQVYRYRNIESKYFCNFLGKAGYKHGLYPRKWFKKTEKIQFEKVQLRVPSGLHDFLLARFGDYLVIPSKDRIKWEQHALFWDVKESYSSNLKSELSFADERNLV